MILRKSRDYGERVESMENDGIEYLEKKLFRIKKAISYNDMKDDYILSIIA